MATQNLNEKQVIEEKSNAVEDFFGRMGILGELLSYLWKQKLYWLIPMVVVLIAFAIIIILGSNPVTAPFIYSIK